MNNDSKTTAAGAVAAGTMMIGAVAPMFGLAIPPEVIQGISAIAMFLWALFTNKKDLGAG